jgi:hypothetical protein
MFLLPFVSTFPVDESIAPSMLRQIPFLVWSRKVRSTFLDHTKEKMFERGGANRPEQ